MNLSGENFGNGKFRLLEDYKIPNLEIIENMLRGGDLDVPLYVVRDYMDPQACMKMQENFYDVVHTTSGGNRADDPQVKVNQIGATQYGKKSADYFDECDETRCNVSKIISGLEHLKIADDILLESSLRSYFLSKKVHFGPSYYRGRYCNLFTARLWKNEQDKKLSLNAHEDLAQLRMANLDNFEIGNVKRVVACNLCVSDEDESTLLVWNIFPNEESKRHLNIVDTGYPYPLSYLDDFEYLTLKTKPGDLYFISANFIHAVQRGRVDNRISLGRFMGYTAENRVAYWT